MKHKDNISLESIDEQSMESIDQQKKSKIGISESLANSEYERPVLTKSEKLTVDEIKELLLDFTEIKDLSDIIEIPIGTPIRYFRTVDGIRKFRYGGILTYNKGYPDYIYLTSGKLTWAVNLKEKGLILFRPVSITIDETKKEYDKVIINLEKKVNALEKENRQLLNLLKLYKKKYG